MPSPLTTSGSAVADVYFGWIVLWSVVDVAFVLGLAAAKIPRLTLTPGRAILFILFLCVANDRAGGGLVGRPLKDFVLVGCSTNAVELPSATRRCGRSIIGRVSCPAGLRRQKPASQVRHWLTHRRHCCHRPLHVYLPKQTPGRCRLQRHHACWAAVWPHNAANRDRSRRTRRGGQYATTWQLFLSV